jgi:hypothetical protein
VENKVHLSHALLVAYALAAHQKREFLKSVFLALSQYKSKPSTYAFARGVAVIEAAKGVVVIGKSKVTRRGIRGPGPTLGRKDPAPPA